MPRTKRRFIWLVAILALVSLVAVGCGDQKADKKEKAKDEKKEEKVEQQAGPLDTKSKKVIAKYEGLTKGEVTEGELNRFINILASLNQQVMMFKDQPEMQEQLLQEFAAQKSIAEQVKVTKKMTDEADKAIDNQREFFEESAKQGDDKDKKDKPQDYEAFLKEKGFTEKDLHAFILNSIKLDEHLSKQLADKDVNAGYDKWKEDKDLRLYSAKIRHILVQVNEERDDKKAKKRVEEVKRKLDKGGDFAKLAKEYSDDPGSKETGGSLGDELTPLAGNLDQDFAKAARDLKLKTVSEPVKTQFGYHIIEVLERQTLKADEAKQLVKRELADEHYRNYVQKDLKVDQVGKKDAKKKDAKKS